MDPDLMRLADDGSPHATPEEPDRSAFSLGYDVCVELFEGPGTYAEFCAATNPFQEGTDQHRGWEKAFYDLTQK